ncbi:serine hydrolase domain-containing protein [Micromonospora sp. NPDC023966]|uniref:serine hydrolase domain-containing protein n=1 Tax=Micromonospora sp. NPDC023966 TaxID=3154699 RepID=UPI0033D585C7
MIEGFTAPGFEPVAEAFERNFTDLGEVGAAFSAYHQGERVVDLWGGQADPETGRRWRADTVQLVFSGTKGLAAACALLLVERGVLDLDAPAARYWPEFAAAGKAGITVGDILSHQARLPGVRERIGLDDLLDHETMAKLLADQAPETDPRAAFIYHALTWGWLVDELVRRVDGRSVGEFFTDEFARPLELDTWIGLPDEHHDRASTMLAAPGFLLTAEPPSTDPLVVLTHNPLVVPGTPAFWNSPEFRQAGLAAVGAFTTARSMARFYASLAAGGSLDGVRVLEAATVELGRRERRRGLSALSGSQMAYGAGFELATDAQVFGPAPDAFGHVGAGGSRHGAWPGKQVAFSYAMNEARAEYPDRRSRALLNALHEAVTALG